MRSHEVAVPCSWCALALGSPSSSHTLIQNCWYSECFSLLKFLFHRSYWAWVHPEHRAARVSALTLTWDRMFLLDLIPLCFFLDMCTVLFFVFCFCYVFLALILLLNLLYENLVGMSLNPSRMKLGLSKTLRYLLIPSPTRAFAAVFLKPLFIAYLDWLVILSSPL